MEDKLSKTAKRMGKLFRSTGVDGEKFDQLAQEYSRLVISLMPYSIKDIYLSTLKKTRNAQRP